MSQTLSHSRHLVINKEDEIYLFSQTKGVLEFESFFYPFICMLFPYLLLKKIFEGKSNIDSTQKNIISIFEKKTFG